MNLKKLIIFPVIIFLILLTAGTILVENMKYSGLNESETKVFKDLERSCENEDYKEACLNNVDRLLDVAKQMQNP